MYFNVRQNYFYFYIDINKYIEVVEIVMTNSSISSFDFSSNSRTATILRTFMGAPPHCLEGMSRMVSGGYQVGSMWESGGFKVGIRWGSGGITWAGVGGAAEGELKVRRGSQPERGESWDGEVQFLFMVGMSQPHLKCCKVPQSASCLICVVGKRI